jgi:hypothetical protein
MVDRRRLVGLALSESAGLGILAFLLYYIPLSGAALSEDFWSTDRVIAYVLLFIAPLFLFAPLSSLLNLGPVGLLGTASWAMLGYVLIFTPAPDGRTADIFTYAAFLGLLYIALSTAFSVPLGALSRRLLPPTRMEWGRALRQGALLALFVVSLLAMSPLGVLNWLNVFLVATIVALAEFFFLARS